jgi:hypothetical protein
MAVRTGGQDEPAIAIAAFDEGLGAQLQVDPRMAQRPADPVAGDAARADGDDLGKAEPDAYLMRAAEQRQFGRAAAAP